MSTRKKILLALAALLIFALLLLSFRPTPVPVSVAQVTLGPLEVTVEQEGRTRVRDRYELTAPVAVFVPRIRFDVGDPVSAGELLLELQPTPSELLDERSRLQAEAAVSEAEAVWNFARRELARLRALHAENIVTESALNEAEAAAAQAEANLRATRAMLIEGGRPRPVVEPLPLVSPVAGQVLAIERQSGGTVPAGTLLLTVGDAGDLEVVVDLLSSDAVRVAPGMPVRLERWGGEGVLEGRVRRIEPTAFTRVSALGVEEQRVWVVVDLLSPPAQWQALGDGYRVEAAFILWAEPDVVRAPTAALFREGGQWVTFVATAEGVAERRQVQVGQRAALAVQVLDGLAPGEWVIVHPDAAVEHGVAIEIRAYE